MTELAQLSLDELLSLQHRAAAEVTARQSADKEKAKQEILAIASKYGIEVKFGGVSALPKAGKAPKARGTVAAKYRHPDNSALTWTGRGRSPVWVAEWKAKHGSLAGITI
ncbi:MAG: H-NS histone family protein [Pseudomonadota bacterium]